jgi:hypothetical protein
VKKQIICINWGSKYGAPYINRLYGMVERNITPPFSFTCFTDNAEGIRPEVRCFDLPPLPAAMPKKSPGKWRKSSLWGPKLGDLQGPVLFIDLDVAITGNLDSFFDYGRPEDTILARNIVKPLNRLGQTSVYRFKVGNLVELQRLYAEDPQGVADRYRFEQHFVTRNAPGGVRFWPWRWVAHFRVQCIPPFPFNFFIAPRLPKKTKILIFAGDTLPPDAIVGRVKASEPVRSPFEHARATLGERQGFRTLRRYALPAPWLASVWRP